MRLWLCAGTVISEDYKSCFPDYVVEDHPADDGSGSGNCMFNAIAHQLELRHYTSGMTGSTLRQQLVEYIEENNTLKALVSSRLVNQSVDSYLQDMAKPGRWRDENFLYAAALRFNCTVCVVRSNGMQTTYEGSSSSPSVSERVMLGYVSCVPGGAPNHYVSLVGKQPVIKENAASDEKISKIRTLTTAHPKRMTITHISAVTNSLNISIRVNVITLRAFRALLVHI